MKVQRGEGCGPSSQAACGRAEERTHFLSTWFISCSPALVPICPRQSTRSSLPLSSFLNSEKMQSHIDNRDTTVFCDDDKSWLPAWTEWSPEDRKSTPWVSGWIAVFQRWLAHKGSDLSDVLIHFMSSGFSRLLRSCEIVWGGAYLGKVGGCGKGAHKEGNLTCSIPAALSCLPANVLWTVFPLALSPWSICFTMGPKQKCKPSNHGWKPRKSWTRINLLSHMSDIVSRQ